MSKPYFLRRGTPLAALAFVIGVAAIYVTRPPTGNGAAKPAAASSPSDTKSDAAAGVSSFVRKAVPEAVPNVRFVAADGTDVALDAWRGRVVLLNLWATWCLPCRKEMPALDRLQAALGSKDFEVVALSIDRSGLAGASKFLTGIGVSKLKLYADPTARIASELKAVGLPTTLLLDRAGREVGRLIGPAEWDEKEFADLVRSVVRP